MTIAQLNRKLGALEEKYQILFKKREENLKNGARMEKQLYALEEQLFNLRDEIVFEQEKNI